MNESFRRFFRYPVFAVTLLAGVSLAAGAFAQSKRTSGSEEFFIVASVDQPNSQFLLKRPTEVTQMMKVNDKTQYLDDGGKPIRLSDFRAGDTVWVISSGGAEPTAVRIRKGQMTLADLHRYYLDYPEIK